MGLEKYFQLEGLAYRFVPYLANSNDGQTGEIATDIMYDNLINKFKWGNMQDPTIYLDETNMRMTMNFRNNFSRLSDALIKKVLRFLIKFWRFLISVLKLCLMVIPHNYFNLPLRNGYYRIRKQKKLEKLLVF